MVGLPRETYLGNAKQEIEKRVGVAPYSAFYSLRGVVRNGSD